MGTSEGIVIREESRGFNSPVGAGCRKGTE